MISDYESNIQRDIFIIIKRINRLNNSYHNLNYVANDVIDKLSIFLKTNLIFSKVELIATLKIIGLRQGFISYMS